MSAMSAPPDPAIIEEIALLKQIDEALVEKDWWVTQVIHLMADISHEGFPLFFTGGTALAKAHHLIQRFSEDIDFRVNASPDAHSRPARSEFKNVIVEMLRSAGFTIEPAQVHARNGNRFFSIDLNYESGFARLPILRPHIQIEVFIEKAQLPPIPLPVASFVNEFSKEPPEVAKIDCIDLVESAADKLSAIAWRIPDRIRGTEHDDSTIVRHIHDLAILKDKALQYAQFAKITAIAVQRDSERPRSIPDYADKPLQQKFSEMLAILAQDKQYPNEYADFVETMSYMKETEPPNFSAAVKAINELVKAATG